MKRSMLLTLTWVMTTSAYIIIFFLSCSDEIRVSVPDESFIMITGFEQNGEGGDVYPESTEDNVIHTFRVLAFDDAYNCVSNVLYFGSALSDVIQHPIKKGTYKFVFLANEPVTVDGTHPKDVTQYSDLLAIHYPANAFSSTLPIPMMQEKTDITVGENGNITEGTNTMSAIAVVLERLAVRVDVILNADEIIGEQFKGVRFRNIPASVPLMGDSNASDALPDGRSFEYSGSDDNYFVKSINAERWQMNINRIILPANLREDSPVEFDVIMDNEDTRSCQLKMDGDYTLSKNCALMLTANISNPLEIIEMEAKPWESVGSNWQTAEIRMLNVSHTSVAITDFNGARISFSSNMPVVRVAETLTDILKSTNTETNFIFNDLAAEREVLTATGDEADKKKPTRFYYKYDALTKTGSGYMDIIADANVMGTNSYTLTLIAENAEGKNQLKREITVTVTQNGMRYNFNESGKKTGYVGAFFRNSEMGERIISGLHPVGKTWTAKIVGADNWFKLSSAPSFDPNVGTDTPGDAEKYKVWPNVNKYVPDNGGGYEVNGRGRVYFRVGAEGKNETGKNRYREIHLSFEGSPVVQSLYIRQGEEPDYVFDNHSAARKFSPYNLTASEFLEPNASEEVVALAVGEGKFVKYPTQAGAFFQWGTEKPEFACRAYHPEKQVDWNFTDNNEETYSRKNTYWINIKAENETCPPNYCRPNDGSESEVVVNNTIGDEFNSTIRTSLFKIPVAGNSYGEYIDYIEENNEIIGIESANPFPTFPLSSPSPIGFLRELPETNEGFYADGFFDRRPIQEVINTVTGDNGKAVSVGKANVAYNGLLFFNVDTNASLFFPFAGRKNDNDGSLEYRGAGYYWSSSAGTSFPNANYPAWWLSLGYYRMEIGTNIKSFGCSIRCVYVKE